MRNNKKDEKDKSIESSSMCPIRKKKDIKNFNKKK